MPHYTSSAFPSFPSDVPVATLNRLSLGKLLRDDAEESATLYESCRSSGFFLLDLKDSEEGEEMLQLVDRLFGLAEELYDLPLEEKQKYALRPGTAFGYKGLGVSKVDSKGTPDRCEFWGVSKDEILGQAPNPSPMPPLFTENSAFLSAIAQQSHSICLNILAHLERHLHLQTGALASLHRFSSPSSDQIRILKMRPQPADDGRTSLLAHTDFGSITLLWNVVGGLQILPAEEGDSDPDGLLPGWKFVQPQHGCVVVNMGDAMEFLSNGVLRSNLHRVTAPPGKQALLERYSAAYFMRPEDDTLMRPLQGGNAIPPVEEAVEGQKWYNVKEWVGAKSDAARKSAAPMRSSGGTDGGR